MLVLLALFITIMQDTVQTIYSPCNFPAGINSAIIANISKARNPDGSVKKKEGNIALKVEFENKEKGHTGELVAYVNPKSQWIWDKLCRAARVSNVNRSPSVKELKGKFIHISVVAVFTVVDGVIEEEPDFTYIEPKFYLNEGMKPAISGDPQRTGKYTEGEFVIIRNIEHSSEDFSAREFGDE